MTSILPPDFDQRVESAVRLFWDTRTGATGKLQGGSRDAVVSGRNMDGFASLVGYVATYCGLPSEAVYRTKGKLILPGFFRATKNWDVVVIHERRLLAVFEFKSQVGSFGNNFNNRSEEAIGSAADLWVAHHEGAFAAQPRQEGTTVAEEPPPAINPAIQSDPRPPFLAWLMLLEDCEQSRRPVGCAEPHYKVFPDFQGASYARRYQLLCERLVERRLYSAAALEMSPANSGSHAPLSPSTSIRNMFAEFAGRLLAAMA